MYTTKLKSNTSSTLILFKRHSDTPEVVVRCCLILKRPDVGSISLTRLDIDFLFRV